MSQKVDEISELDDSELILLFDTDTGEEKEAIVVKDQHDEPQIWLNYCQHITTVKLDDGDGLTERGDEIVCENHGAMFEKSTGRCTYGPCKGAVLPSVSTVVDQGVLYIDDERYELESKNVENNNGLGSTSGESDYS